jgi:hypothetical protein
VPDSITGLLSGLDAPTLVSAEGDRLITGRHRSIMGAVA